MDREKLPGTRTGLCKRIWLRYPDPSSAGEATPPEMLELKIYVHTGEYPDGRLGEVFIKADKAGSLISGLLDTASISISLGLQYGVPLDSLLEKYLGLSFESEGTTSDEMMPRVRSITDAVARWLRKAYPEGRRANPLPPEGDKEPPVVLPAFTVKGKA